MKTTLFLIVVIVACVVTFARTNNTARALHAQHDACADIIAQIK